MAVTNSAPITKNDYPVIASILVEALYYGVKDTASRYKISQRTIANYRGMLADNEDLSVCFKVKKEQFEANWAEEIPATVRTAMRYIQRASQELTVTPEALHAVAGALKIVSEIGLTKEIIDAKLGRFNLPDRTEN